MICIWHRAQLEPQFSSVATTTKMKTARLAAATNGRMLSIVNRLFVLMRQILFQILFSIYEVFIIFCRLWKWLVMFQILLTVSSFILRKGVGGWDTQSLGFFNKGDKLSDCSWFSAPEQPVGVIPLPRKGTYKKWREPTYSVSNASLKDV